MSDESDDCTCPAGCEHTKSKAPVAYKSDREAGIDSLQWVPASNGVIPPYAVPGGEDLAKNVAYIGRAKIQDFLLPARVVPRSGCCYVALYGSDNPTKSYEVLTNPKNAPLRWVFTKDGSIPPNPVPGGNDGKDVYIGRREMEGCMLLGKIHSNINGLWVPLRGNEYKFTADYEILTCTQ